MTPPILDPSVPSATSDKSDSPPLTKADLALAIDAAQAGEVRLLETLSAVPCVPDATLHTNGWCIHVGLSLYSKLQHHNARTAASGQTRSG